ncbi:hypothetical protein M422DRAFT_43159 [Sphaerobolus stellatus SS14]|nr:hypothetical protein M422DRAFT_43159 [Sphaerobolus stellatus SS14]
MCIKNMFSCCELNLFWMSMKLSNFKVLIRRLSASRKDSDGFPSIIRILPTERNRQRGISLFAEWYPGFVESMAINDVSKYCPVALADDENMGGPVGYLRLYDSD